MRWSSPSQRTQRPGAHRRPAPRTNRLRARRPRRQSVEPPTLPGPWRPPCLCRPRTLCTPRHASPQRKAGRPPLGAPRLWRTAGLSLPPSPSRPALRTRWSASRGVVRSAWRHLHQTQGQPCSRQGRGRRLPTRRTRRSWRKQARLCGRWRFVSWRARSRTLFEPSTLHACPWPPMPPPLQRWWARHPAARQASAYGSSRPPWRTTPRAAWLPRARCPWTRPRRRRSSQRARAAKRRLPWPRRAPMVPRPPPDRPRQHRTRALR